MILLFISSIIYISCQKKEQDDPIPIERKNYAWACGSQDSSGVGTILFSADGGKSWVRQAEENPLLQGIDITDIFAVDENHIWATGTQNTLLFTNDGGANWSKAHVPENSSNPDLICISVYNRQQLWISGDHGTVFSSNDNGLNWITYDSGFFQGGMMQGIYALNDQKVFVVGGVSDKLKNDRGFIGYTEDGGANWDTTSLNNNYNRNEWIGVKAYKQTIVVYGSKSHYTYSLDGGQTWTNDSIDSSGGGGAADLNGLTMIDKDTWWGAFDMNQIYKTTDAGKNWLNQNTPVSGYFLLGIDAYDNNLALSVGSNSSWPLQGTIIRTEDGKTWTEVFNSNIPLAAVSFIKKSML